MDDITQKIIKLRIYGISESEIAKQLNISTEEVLSRIEQRYENIDLDRTKYEMLDVYTEMVKYLNIVIMDHLKNSQDRDDSAITGAVKQISDLQDKKLILIKEIEESNLKLKEKNKQITLR